MTAAVSMVAPVNAGILDSTGRSRRSKISFTFMVHLTKRSRPPERASYRSERNAALDLPMKLLLWKREDGAAFLSFKAAEFLAARHALTDAETDALRVVADIAAAAVPS